MTDNSRAANSTNRLDLELRRILVALDPALPSASALDVVASLIGDVSVELLGLFIEDIELLRISNLPVVQEICGVSGEARPLDSLRVQRQMRARAREVQRRFEEAASRLPVQHSFHVARGHVVEELQRAAEKADLLILSCARKRAGQRSWYGATIHRIALPGAGAVLIVQEDWRKGSNVVLLREPGAAHSRGLAIAAHIAAQEQLGLTILDCEDSVAEPSDDASLLESLSLHSVERRAIDVVSSVELIGISHNADARVLVLPRSHPEINEHMLQRLVNKLDCSLIIV